MKLGTSKQMLPVYDKLLIDYPLATLIFAGIHEVLITTTHEADAFHQLLGDGEQLGVEFTFAVQPEPKGLAQAFTIGADFVAGEPSWLILADNILSGPGLGTRPVEHTRSIDGAPIFGSQVADPTAYGVVEVDPHGLALPIEENPAQPKYHWAAPVLYFYDQHVVDIATNPQPSPRGEYEITDVNRTYVEQGRLHVDLLPRGTAWLDNGTFDSLIDASNFVRTIQVRQGILVGCPEEAAWRGGFLTDDDRAERAQRYAKSGYGTDLADLACR